MRMVLCHHYSLTFLGGGKHFLIDAANQLTKRGHEVAIHALPFGKRPVDIQKQLQGIEYHESMIHNIRDTRASMLWRTQAKKYTGLSLSMTEPAPKYDVNVVFPKFLNMLEEVASD